MLPAKSDFLSGLRRKLVPVLAAVFLSAAGNPIALAADKQKSFTSPEDAAKELVAAVRAGDAKAMLAVLGTDAGPIIQSGDAVADKAGRERFVKAYEEANKLEKAGDARFVLSVGKDNWPLPIPIVKDAAGWRFDTAAAKEEILNRRIGRNELSTIQAIQAYVDAQREYYLRNPQNDKVLHYAQKIMSAEGKRDGLYYPTKSGERVSPLGPLFAGTRTAGYEKGKDTAGKSFPYLGYRYRVLKAQGPDAPGGAYSYLAQGRMLGGFALVAWPAQYGNSGVMTFIVNHDGVVYEKDLGPDTAQAVQKITRFNPDKSWKKH